MTSIGDGPEVEFFGERTTLPGGAATLALRTGAPIVPDRRLLHRPSRRTLRLGPAADLVERSEKRLRDDVARVTQDSPHELEILIRRAPFQWHLFQPNWPSDPGYGS